MVSTGSFVAFCVDCVLEPHLLGAVIMIRRALNLSTVQELHLHPPTITL